MSPAASHSQHEISEVSLRRLPVYYRTLQHMRALGIEQASCSGLARRLALDPSQVRKDIEMTGIVGRPRTGYDVAELTLWIEDFLGWNRPKEAVLVGAGSLGSALLGYKEFRTHGMEIIAVFDVDRAKIGRRIHGREVQSLDALSRLLRRSRKPLGLIATPIDAAQSVADLMVAGGIRAIWNFAPAHITVPESVILQNEDFYYSLASLSFKLERQLHSSPLPHPSLDTLRTSAPAAARRTRKKASHVPQVMTKRNEL